MSAAMCPTRQPDSCAAYVRPVTFLVISLPFAVENGGICTG